jgi:hypothetical protein
MRRDDAARAMVVGLLAWLAAAAMPVRGVAAPAASRSGQPATPGHGSTAGPPPAAPGEAAAAAPTPALAQAPVPPGSTILIAPQSTPAQQGGPASAAGARQLLHIRQAARRLQASLASLAGAAQRQGDTARESELAQLDVVLGQLAAARRLTLAVYLTALNAGGEARALWAGNTASLDPGQEPALQEAEAAASDLTTAAETGFVFVADLDGGRAWTYVESGAPPGGDAGGPVGEGPEADDLDATAGGGAAADDAGLGPMPMASPGTGDDQPSAAKPTAAVGAGAEAGAAGDAAALDAGISLHGEPQPVTLDSPESMAELGRPAEDERDPAGPESLAGVDTAAGAPPLAWEDLCRPWRPRASASAASGGGLCRLPSAASEPQGPPAWPREAAPPDLPGAPATRRTTATDGGAPADLPGAPAENP